MSDYLSPAQARSRLAVSRTLFDKKFRPQLTEYRFGDRAIRYAVAEVDELVMYYGMVESLDRIDNEHPSVVLGKLLRAAKPFSRTSGVYFLFHEESLVYIGQSWHVYARLPEHSPGVNGRADRPWDRVAIFEAPPEKLIGLERLFIRRLSPLHNRRVA